MKLDLLTSLYVFMLAAFIGFEVIRRVSPLLHTPLMSLTNALDAIALVGANDVTNPAARTDASSPIFGMPILDVDKARTVMVIKRSMAAGFAGIDNPLYYLEAIFKMALRMYGGGKKERKIQRRDAMTWPPISIPPPAA
jgi:NAD(P) transhydrogenase beta subunit/4TM region of pyridine nucleotide transhydrogenase, mitoch